MDETQPQSQRKIFFYITDFDMKTSGYTNIGISLCSELSKYQNVIGLGMSYNREEHNFPFNLARCTFEMMPNAMDALEKFLGANLGGFIIACDIPKALELARKVSELKTPLYGLYPVEAPPLSRDWATQLWRFKHHFVMSRFGCAEFDRFGLPNTYLDVAVDLNKFRPPTSEERDEIRHRLHLDDKFVVLTVATNQERKYIPAELEIISKLKKAGHNVQHMLITTRQDAYGFRIEELAEKLDIVDCVQTWERGLEFKTMWTLFAAADLYLTTSKAEGLAMPVLEAMACRLPVVGTDCTAIHEHLTDGRGLLVSPEYEYIEAWGNCLRWFIDVEGAVWKIRDWTTWCEEKKQSMLDNAQSYIASRSWEETGKAINEVLK